MKNITDLIVEVLADQVEGVADRPRRVLFRGVSAFFDAFAGRAARERPPWDVRITKEGVDIVGARNDGSIDTLVVFYRDQVRERESLNAFRQYDENALVESVLQFVLSQEIGGYKRGDEKALRSLLGLVYPSAEQLAGFLLEGKAHLGKSLPLLGLFSDPGLSTSLPPQRWLARCRDNQAAIMRWRDFLEIGQRRQDARSKLGKERLALLHTAELDPSVRDLILRKVTLDEALWVLNPPSQLVSSLIGDGLARERAEQLVSDIKSGKVDPDHLPADIPPLPEVRRAVLRRIRPSVEPPPDSIPRVASCLEGLLLLARDWRPPFPSDVRIYRADREEPDAYAEVRVTPDGRLEVNMGPEATRVLSTPNAGASELQFAIHRTGDAKKPLMYFTLENLSGRLEPFSEIWPPAELWEQAAGLEPQYATLWENLHGLTERLRDVIDPDWRNEQSGDEATPGREPNNAIYLIFDLVYMANRQLFDDFNDAWLRVATLPWRANVAANPEGWRKAIAGLLDIGLAQSDGALAVLPFYSLRLAWHRTVFSAIESWLVTAAGSQAFGGLLTRIPWMLPTSSRSKALVFEPDVLAAQLQVAERPHALIRSGVGAENPQRFLEASAAPFFSIFVPETRKVRMRAPLDRAGQKLEQFSYMWPFSLHRLHLAFQPADAGQDMFRLLAHEAEKQPDSAFAVRALVESTGTMTALDGLLFQTGDDTTDLLTQEYHESLLPRVYYTKGALKGGAQQETQQPTTPVHAALLVDAFREEGYGFEAVVGQINNPDWQAFTALASSASPEVPAQLKTVSLSAPPFHYGQVRDNLRQVVYVPLDGGQPEYLCLLVHSLYAWMMHGAFRSGAYCERVRWDAEALSRLHDDADWVLLFDRTLEKGLFESLAQRGVKLIDYYPNLRGGYRLSVSSRRTEAVAWQLVQVLHQFFADTSLNSGKLAERILNTLSGFASGLLLKTLGGGSLAQELLGLYATYFALIEDNLYRPGVDWLIPLDDYQGWFGRRTQRGRRADLLVLSNPTPDCLRMLAIESKWYKNLVNNRFVEEEFGSGGQLATAVEAMRSLFDPRQERVDMDYWQKTLQSLLQSAPVHVPQLRDGTGRPAWKLEVDGKVYVHQYAVADSAAQQHQNEMAPKVAAAVSAQRDLFSLAPDAARVRLLGRPELIKLLEKSCE